MSLNYNLPNASPLSEAPMTNKWLADNYPKLHADLFGISVSTISVGVPEINGKWYDRIRRQVIAGDKYMPFMSVAEELDFWTLVLNVLYGMTTNASHKTEKQFASEVEKIK